MQGPGWFRMLAIEYMLPKACDARSDPSSLSHAWHSGQQVGSSKVERLSQIISVCPLCWGYKIYSSKTSNRIWQHLDMCWFHEQRLMARRIIFMDRTFAIWPSYPSITEQFDLTRSKLSRATWWWQVVSFDCSHALSLSFSHSPYITRSCRYETSIFEVQPSDYWFFYWFYIKVSAQLRVAFHCNPLFQYQWSVQQRWT